MSKHKTMTPVGTKLRLRWLALSCVVAGACLLTSGPAVASAATPAWGITATSQPTNFTPGRPSHFLIAVTNVGSAPTDGSPAMITYTLPAGLTPLQAGGALGGVGGLSCTISGQTVTCERTSPNVFEPGEFIAEGLTVEVEVSPMLSGTTVTTTVSVSGGGAPTASTAVQTAIGSTDAPFGLATFSSPAIKQDGTPYTQAGGHPYSIATTLVFNTTGSGIEVTDYFGNYSRPAGNLNGFQIGLPPGLIGNPQAIPQCTQDEYREKKCPPSSQIGVARVFIASGPGPQSTPVYNLIPPPGVAAQFAFAFETNNIRVRLDARVRTGSDYGATLSASGITQLAGTVISSVTLWGVPGDPSHDGQRCQLIENRNSFCGGEAGTDYGPHPGGVPPKPFLILPTTCQGVPQQLLLEADSWQEPGQFVSAMTSMPANTGCESLDFSPTLQAQPTTNTADSPSGLSLDLHLPTHEGCEEAGGELTCENAEADLKDAVVTLPAGLVIDPSSDDHLEACSEQQMGYLPEKSAEVGEPQFTPDAAQCPDNSKLGTVEITTPLLDHPLPGGVYLAAQNANPFKSLLALYIAVNDPISGVVIKLPGKLTADPATGQLTATFDQAPQLPFTDFKLNLFQGTRAALTTPLTCGSYSASSDLTPWTAPVGKDAFPAGSPFTLGGCAPSEAQAPNSPTLEAGTASPIAGSYSPFVLTLSREDGSQRFSAVNVTLPPGLSGKVAGVEECPQADIDAAKSKSNAGEGASELAHPSCPAASEVGVVHVGLGSGTPLYVTGHAYFAGPYEGAPFSLVFITPAVAGPFDLGSTVVRAALFIDPNTAQVTVKSDPLPTILDGIPLDIRNITVEVNRHEFTLNPTSCDPMSVSGQEASTTGQVAALSDRFQAGGCTTLPFRPSFEVSASANANSKEGAALIVHLNAGSGQANLARVHVELPKQLPSRLTTLQKACQDTVFNANPANCPAPSRVGYATASTPILPVPIAGPAYFVSHGGAKFPELIMVLSGDGVTVDLHGETFINKANITSSTFPSLPDVPVSSFELKLPEGPYSALDANGDLCAQKLTMPTTITGQNGAQVKQQTPIVVEGCKPEMRVLRHRVKGKRASIQVSVPSAGTLVASGRALRRTVKRVGKAKVVTIGVRLSKHDLRVLSHHPHQRVNANVELRFTPKQGAPMTAHLKLLMG